MPRRPLPITADDLAAKVARQREFTGWEVVPKPDSSGRLVIEVQDPRLSQKAQFSLSPDEFVTRGNELIRGFARLPEVKLLNSAPTRPSNSRLLVELRRTASAYAWSFETYRQVIELLEVAEVIPSHEFEWLLDAGPWSHPFWVGYMNDRPAWRGLPAGSAEQQYKVYRRLYFRGKRRHLNRSRTEA